VNHKLTERIIGTLSRIAGSFVTAKGMPNAKMFELVKIGEAGIIGEIIRISGNTSIIQAYEETEGIKLGEKVIGTGELLSVDLGPGLMGQIIDGIQRPLPLIAEKIGPWIKKGIEVPAIDRNKKWQFHPIISKGAKVTSGDILGVVQETPSVENRIMVPPDIAGIVKTICWPASHRLLLPCCKGWDNCRYRWIWNGKDCPVANDRCMDRRRYHRVYRLR